MKNKFIVLVLMLLACSSSLLQLQAQEYQEFAPIGAKWWYQNAYVESVRDTLVMDKKSKILKIEKETGGEINIQAWEVIIYQDGNTIYYYLQEEFQILFEFRFAEYEECDPEFSPTVSVWKEEKLDVNGTELTRFFAIYNTIFFSFNFTIVERIGGNLFLSCIDPDLGTIEALKCYEDNEIGRFCDENLWTHFEDTPSSVSTNIYPNPYKQGVHSSLHLQSVSSDITHLELLNLNGQVVYRQEIKGLNTIPIDEKFNILEEGLYILRLTKETIPIAYFKFLIQ